MIYAGFHGIAIIEKNPHNLLTWIMRILLFKYIHVFVQYVH